MQLTQTLLITLVAFFAYMHCYFGSTMWNRPIVVAPLVGLVMGDLTTGIKIGATLELIFMGAFPIGASNPPDFVSGAIISTAYVISTGQEITAAVILAVPIATLVLFFDNFLMTFLLSWTSHVADRYAAQGDIRKVELTQIFAGIGNKVILAIVVGLGFYLGVPVIESVLAGIPEWIIRGMDVAASIIPAIGFAMLARMMVSKKLLAFLILGFLMAAYLNIPVLGVALFGLVIVLLFMNFDLSKKEAPSNDNEF